MKKLRKILISAMTLLSMASLSACNTNEYPSLYDYEIFAELRFIDQYMNFDETRYYMQASYLSNFKTDEELFKFLFPERTTKYFRCFELYHGNQELHVSNYKSLIDSMHSAHKSGDEHVVGYYEETTYYTQNGKALCRLGIRLDVRVVYDYNTYTY